MRAVVPVEADDGAVVGLVSIGILRQRVGEELLKRVPLLAGVSLAALALAALGSMIISRRLSAADARPRPCRDHPDV